jgi:hypothetical protein
VRTRAAFAALVLLAEACSSRQPRAALNLDQQPARPQPSDDASDWALHVRPAELPTPAKPTQPALDIRTAVMSDEVEASDDPVVVARLVYRASFYVPASFRDRRVGVRAPAGELHIDVSENRLRARFIGPGWPVPEGSEVRLRPDLPGVYLFDSRGGRSLGAGQLAAWFEGREAHKAEALVGVARDYSTAAQKPLPTDLVCALLAEWSNQEREALAYRCKDGSVPPGFRVGPWSGELTAVVPMSVTRRALRADEVDPPTAIAARQSGVLLEPAALAQLPVSRALAGTAPGSLVIDNHTDARAIMLAQGVAVGWVEAGESLQLDGLQPGLYLIGAIRPLGILRMAPKLVRVPGHLVIGRGVWRELVEPSTAPAGAHAAGAVPRAPASATPSVSATPPSAEREQ